MVHGSPVKIIFEEIRLKGEQVKNIMVMIKSRDLGIGTVWMISLLLLILWTENNFLGVTV